MVTLQATSVFWLARENRHVFPGEQFEIERAEFPNFAPVAKHLVSGKLFPDRPAKFTDRLVEKTKSVLGLAAPAADSTRSTRFECAECDQVFKAAKGLEIHMKNAHAKPDETKESA